MEKKEEGTKEGLDIEWSENKRATVYRRKE